MKSDVTYTFNIINLMKADSLYNYGECESSQLVKLVHYFDKFCSVCVHTHTPHIQYITRLFMVYFSELYLKLKVYRLHLKDQKWSS